MKTGRKAFFADQSGGVAVITAVAISALLGFAALALDVAHVAKVKGELEKAADAAALAGARALWPMNLPITQGNPPRIPQCTPGYNAALSQIQNNQVDGADLPVDDVSVQVGHWDFGVHQFAAGCTATTNAVKVSATKRNVSMYFAQIFGLGARDITASATGVMDTAKSVGWGGLPIALNKDYTTAGAYIYIDLNPATTDNGGWFCVPPDRASAQELKDYIKNGVCPPLYIGQIINLQNGVDASVLETLRQMKDTYHPDGWDTFLPVVDTTTFNQEKPIDSFVPFRLTEVVPEGQGKHLGGYVLGMAELAGALPGGPNFGALAPPKLVN